MRRVFCGCSPWRNQARRRGSSFPRRAVQPGASGSLRSRESPPFCSYPLSRSLDHTRSPDGVIELLSFFVRTPKRQVNGGALPGGEHPCEGGDLSEVLAVFAGIEHTGDDLVGRPLQNPVPFIRAAKHAG